MRIHRWVFVFLVFLCFSLQAEKKTICLNMIVKDEKDVIVDCLNSVKPIIDTWVIFDTGSTDGTQKAIRKCMKGIPGELHESPWVNFEHNRNEALEVAKKKADYILWIDADEVLEYTSDFALPNLHRDFYHMIMNHGFVEVMRCALIKSSLDWRWVGVLHEVLHCQDAKTHDKLEGVQNVCNPTHLGARSKTPPAEKYFNDALVLEEALKKEPNNSRYVYYLGISYGAADHDELALKAFERRIEMPSADLEETYHAFYYAGLMCEKMRRYERASDYFLKAFQFRPTRAEPLCHAAGAQRKSGHTFLGYLISKHATTLPYPEGDACVGFNAYNYEAEVELANCALLLGYWEEGLKASESLNQNPDLPEEYLPSVRANIDLAKKNLTERKKSFTQEFSASLQ